RPNGCVQFEMPAFTSTVEPVESFANEASSVTSKPEPRSTWAPVENAALTAPPPYENESLVGDVKEIQLGSTVLPDDVGKFALSDMPAGWGLEPSRLPAVAELPRVPSSSISDPAGQPNTSRTDEGRSSTAIFAAMLSPPLNSTVSGTVP